MDLATVPPPSTALLRAWDNYTYKSMLNGSRNGTVSMFQLDPSTGTPARQAVTEKLHFGHIDTHAGKPFSKTGLLLLRFFSTLSGDGNITSCAEDDSCGCDASSTAFNGSCISEHFLQPCSPERSYRFSSSSSMTFTVLPALLNECADKSLNDCDPSATCMDNPLSYECLCRENFLDVSPDPVKKPGRKCMKRKSRPSFTLALPLHCPERKRILHESPYLLGNIEHREIAINEPDCSLESTVMRGQQGASLSRRPDASRLKSGRGLKLLASLLG